MTFLTGFGTIPYLLVRAIVAGRLRSSGKFSYRVLQSTVFSGKYYFSYFQCMRDILHGCLQSTMISAHSTVTLFARFLG